MHPIRPRVTERPCRACGTPTRLLWDDGAGMTLSACSKKCADTAGRERRERMDERLKKAGI